MVCGYKSTNEIFARKEEVEVKGTVGVEDEANGRGPVRDPSVGRRETGGEVGVSGGKTVFSLLEDVGSEETVPSFVRPYSPTEIFESEVFRVVR